MNFTIYSKPGCPYCVKVESLLEKLKLNKTVYTLGKDFTREIFYEKFGIGSTFPQVILNNSQVIGGCTDTISYLKENNIV